MKTEGDVYERVRLLTRAFISEEAERLKMLDSFPPIDEERMRKYINENYPDSCKPIIVNGNDSSGLFPFGKFKIAVNPDNAEPPYFHVFADGWDISMRFDGKIFRINREGVNKAVCKYVMGCFPEWLKSPSKCANGQTNEEFASDQWYKNVCSVLRFLCKSDQEVLEKFQEVAAKEGWYDVEISNMLGLFDDHPYYQIVASRNSPSGVRLNISLAMEKNEGIPDLQRDLEKQYTDFDVSRETYVWLGKDGHGTCGAPYELIDVYHDALERRSYIKGLCEKLGEAIQK